MSLETDGVWKSGVWATTVWAAGVWREGAYVAVDEVGLQYEVTDGPLHYAFSGPLHYLLFMLLLSVINYDQIVSSTY